MLGLSLSLLSPEAELAVLTELTELILLAPNGTGRVRLLEKAPGTQRGGGMSSWSLAGLSLLCCVPSDALSNGLSRGGGEGRARASASRAAVGRSVGDSCRARHSAGSSAGGSGACRSLGSKRSRPLGTPASRKQR